jgi:THO complex subunit 2
MADLDVWHSSQDRYNREALGIDLDVKKEEGKAAGHTLPGMLFRARAGAEMTPMTWEQFRNFYAKCHNALSNVSPVLTGNTKHLVQLPENEDSS